MSSFMTFLEACFHADWAERMGWTLLYSLWQIALVAAAYAAATLLLRNRAASARYVVGCVALLAMLGLPMSTYVLLPRDVLSTTVAGVERAAAVPLAESPAWENRLAKPDLPAAEPTATPFDSTSSETRPTPGVGSTLLAGLLSPVRPYLPWATAAWLAGVLLLSIRPFWGWLHVRRLQRHGLSPLSETLQRVGERLMRRLGVNRAVRFAQSALVEVPTVVGYLRPLVLLPASAITGLSISEIEMILAHELAHVRRHDYVANLVQTVIEALLFYHPGMWWVSSQIRRERENCCDDIAVALSGSRASYVQALARLEEQRSATPAAVLAATGGSLLSRVRRLLGQPHNEFGYRNATAWLVGLVTIGLVAAALAMNGVAQGYIEGSPEETVEVGELGEAIVEAAIVEADSEKPSATAGQAQSELATPDSQGDEQADAAGARDIVEQWLALIKKGAKDEAARLMLRGKNENTDDGLSMEVLLEAASQGNVALTVTHDLPHAAQVISERLEEGQYAGQSFIFHLMISASPEEGQYPVWRIAEVSLFGPEEIATQLEAFLAKPVNRPIDPCGFGPIMERTLRRMPSHTTSLDLDANRVIRVPNDFGTNRKLTRDPIKWIAVRGIDIGPGGNSRRDTELRGLGGPIKALQVGNELWDESDAAQVRRKLSTLDQQGMLSAKLRTTDGSYPVTYVFETMPWTTDESHQGILQLLAIDQKEQTVKLRYKLVGETTHGLFVRLRPEKQTISEKKKAAELLIDVHNRGPKTYRVLRARDGLWLEVDGKWYRRAVLEVGTVSTKEFKAGETEKAFLKVALQSGENKDWSGGWSGVGPPDLFAWGWLSAPKPLILNTRTYRIRLALAPQPQDGERPGDLEYSYSNLIEIEVVAKDKDESSDVPANVSATSGAINPGRFKESTPLTKPIPHNGSVVEYWDNGVTKSERIYQDGKVLSAVEYARDGMTLYEMEEDTANGADAATDVSVTGRVIGIEGVVLKKGKPQPDGSVLLSFPYARKDGSVIDVASGRVVRPPHEEWISLSGEEWAAWIEKESRGDFYLAGPASFFPGGLIAVRAMRSLSLPITNWAEANSIPDEVLLRNLTRMEPNQFVNSSTGFCAVLTRDGVVAVLRILDFDRKVGQMQIDLRVRGRVGDSIQPPTPGAHRWKTKLIDADGELASETIRPVSRGYDPAKLVGRYWSDKEGLVTVAGLSAGEHRFVVNPEWPMPTFVTILAPGDLPEQVRLNDRKPFAMIDLDIKTELREENDQRTIDVVITNNRKEPYTLAGNDLQLVSFVHRVFPPKSQQRAGAVVPARGEGELKLTLNIERYLRNGLWCGIGERRWRYPPVDEKTGAVYFHVKVGRVHSPGVPLVLPEKKRG